MFSRQTEVYGVPMNVTSDDCTLTARSPIELQSVTGIPVSELLAVLPEKTET